MEDKELKKRLSKVPNADKNGDPIYKIDETKTAGKKTGSQARRQEKRESK